MMGMKDHRKKIINTCEDLEKYLLISQLPPMCHKNQNAFLSNLNNEIQLIVFLADLLTLNQHMTKISDGDAVTLIVSTTLSFAKNVDMNLYKEGKSTQNKVAWLWHNIH